MSTKETAWDIYQSVIDISEGMEGFDIEEALEEYGENISADLDYGVAGRHFSASSLALSAGMSEHLARIEENFSLQKTAETFEQMMQKIQEKNKNIGSAYMERDQMRQYAQLYQKVVEAKDLDVDPPPTDIYFPRTSSDPYKQVREFLDNISAELEQITRSSSEDRLSP